MAKKALAFMLLVVFVAALQKANADQLISVSGKVWCSATGSACVGCSGLAGATVNLYFKNVLVATVTANSEGGFSFSANVEASGSVQASDLTVKVPLPVVQCPPLATATGSLTTAVQFLSVGANGDLQFTATF